MNNENAIQLLNTSAFVYLASCLLFFLAISLKRASNKIFFIGKVLFSIAFLCHTAGLFIRWYEGGILRPPWTNLYESLVFFAWGISAFSTWGLWGWGMPFVGAIATPIIFLLMGMSVMTPNKSIEPLIPALQSYWLKIHVVFGMIAYAAFTVSACLAILHMLKNKVALSKIGAYLSIGVLLCLLIMGGKDFWVKGEIHLAKVTTTVLASGEEVQVKDQYREYEGGPLITNMEAVPGSKVPFWIGLVLFSGLAIGYFLTKGEGNNVGPKGRWGFVGATAWMIGMTWFLLHAMDKSPTVSAYSNAYMLMILFIAVLFCLLFLLFLFRWDFVFKSLPDAERIDELSYKNILLGFPFQTLLLITGAIWAYYAWGRSWGWDPKETWALITWFVYLIYLHGKLLLRWKANVLSALSLVGFLVMVFAFLGVNLVLSGLHSYGGS